MAGRPRQTGCDEVAPRGARLGPGSISAVIAVHDEGQVIGRCLESLRGVVDEVIVVHDGLCADRTLEIAAQHGARTFVRDRTGVPEGHTAFAYEVARGEWLLNVDADEFLSDELRANLRSLARAEAVDGYRFRWPEWDGSAYRNPRGPYKLVMMRRDRTSLEGIPHAIERVAGVVRRSDLLLEHRPRNPNYTARTFMYKWRRWALVHASTFVADYDTLDTFRPRRKRWPLGRRVANALSPVIFLPYGALSAVMAFRDYRNDGMAARDSVRPALYHGAYQSLVQLNVAAFRYGRRRAKRRGKGS